MDATSWLQSNHPFCNRGPNELPDFGSLDSTSASGQEPISVAVLCADRVIAAGLATVLGCHPAFQIIPTRESSPPNDSYPPADVVLADYETAMYLAKCAPQWMARLLVFCSHNGEARICLALKNGARGYLLHGASVIELIDAIRSVRGGGVALSPVVAARLASRVKGQILTPREKAVLEQLMDGRRNKVIAAKLNMSVGTVKSHIKSILEKLDAESRTAAVIEAQRRGLLA